MVSDNNAAELISHMDTTDARYAVEEVANQLSLFKKQHASSKYLKRVNEMEFELPEIDDTLDFILDFTDCFDFSSWLVMDQLDDAEQALTNLKSKVDSLLEKLNSISEKVLLSKNEVEQKFVASLGVK
jgi:septation ring formation regulator EzrA